MTAKINYAGTRQGMLYISHQTKTPPDRSKKEIWWHCACDCGRTEPLSSYQLHRGRKDCGCKVPIKPPIKNRSELLMHPVIEQFLYSRPQEVQS